MIFPLMIFIIIQALAFACLCAYIAGAKNRNVLGWYALGFFFSVIALIVLAAVPTTHILTDRNGPPRRTFWILAGTTLLIFAGATVQLAWENLWLPAWAYEVYPSPMYKLTVVMETFNKEFNAQETRYYEARLRDRSAPINQMIRIIDTTINQVNGIDGLDTSTRQIHLGRLLQMRYMARELKRLMNS